jgi:putative hydrolase of the HAD superfamily
MTTHDVAEVVRTKKAVVFDLFHTLTSLESTWGDGRPYTHQMLGVTKEAWNEQLERFSRDRLTGTQNDALTIVGNLAHTIDPSITDDVIVAATTNRIARFADALLHMPVDTQLVLRALKSSGKRLGLISNADVMEVAAWSKCPIANIFDSTVFSCNVGCVKPEPEIYSLSLRELGVSPNETLFVGDGGSNELAGARSLGITTVMITGIIHEMWPERIPERRRHADYVIKHLRELIN